MSKTQARLVAVMATIYPDLAAENRPAQLARDVGVDGRTVRRWLDGTRNLPRPAARLIKRMLADAELTAEMKGDG